MSFPNTDHLTHDHVFLGSAHDRNAGRMLWVVGLTAAMMVGEIVAGYLTGSMALLADGVPVTPYAGPEQGYKITPAQLEAAAKAAPKSTSAASASVPASAAPAAAASYPPLESPRQ